MLASLYASELGTQDYWRGENTRPSPFWCLGISASVFCHQVPEDTTKSTAATGKRGPKGWAPGVLWPPSPPPRQEEERGTKGALREPGLSAPRPTVHGRGAASAVLSQPGRGRNFTAPGATGLPKAPCSGFRLPASDSVGAANNHSSFQDLRREPRAMETARVLVSKRARGACDARPPAWISLRDFRLFENLFRLLERRKITTETLGTATKCFH